MCYIAVCACIGSAELQSSKSPPKVFIHLKEKADPDLRLKRLIKTRPTCLRHDVEIFAYCRPNVHSKKEGMVSVTALVLMQPCQGDTVYLYCLALYLAFQK